VRNKVVLRRVKEKRIVLHAIKKGSLPGEFASCAGTSFENTILKER
jgi:hypothetical protein